jgi:nucleoside-diphosphate kinase
MECQKTLIIIKPDGMVKSLTGNIISKLSEAKLKIVGAKIVKVSRELAEQHYNGLKEDLIQRHDEEKGAEIFENVLRYLQGEFHTDRVFVMVYSGEDAVAKVRAIAGKTNPEKADPTTIRGKYGRINSNTGVFETAIHASDTLESAEREIALWFEDHEIVE